MKFKRPALFPRSLHLRLSLALWLIVLVLAASQLFLLLIIWEKAHYDRFQRLHWNVAEELAHQLRPRLAGGAAKLEIPELEKFFERARRLNPSLDLFLIAADGRLILAHTLYPPVRQQIDTAPIEEFLKPTPGRELPLLGPDPTDKREVLKIFSAARIRIGSDPAYLYVILSGSLDRMFKSAVLEHYLIVGGLILSLITAVGAGGLGSIVFALMTRRYRKLVHSVAAINESNLSRGIPVEGSDEVGQLGHVINIMAQRIAEATQKVKDTDALRRQLIATVTHDLNEPIAAVQSLWEMSLRPDASPESRQQYAHSGLLNTKRLSKLVEDLFELSKLEARDRTPELGVFDIRETLEEDILPALNAKRSKRGVEISTEFAAELPPVSADLAMVQRILSNLVENAIRYGREQGRIKISACCKENFVWISVADDGPGIAAKDLPHIFDPFYRGERRRQNETEVKGSGLGLAIVKKLVELQGGTVLVKSSAESGTEFSFSLPAAESGVS